MILPKYLKSYFWDTDAKTLDFKQNADFILTRILEYGDGKATGWMFENFSKTRIKNTPYSRYSLKNLSPKSANFWAIILGLDKSKILCLKKSLQKQRSRIWPH